jgi:hypothetical protein
MRYKLRNEIAKSFDIYDLPEKDVADEVRELFNKLGITEEYTASLNDNTISSDEHIRDFYRNIKYCLTNNDTTSEDKNNILVTMYNSIFVLFACITGLDTRFATLVNNDKRVNPVNFIEVFLTKCLYDWMYISENKYLQCAATFILVRATAYSFKDFLNLRDKIFIDFNTNNLDNMTHVEFIARTTIDIQNQNHYKILMYYILNYIFGELGINYYTNNKDEDNKIKNKVINDVYKLLYYNQDSNNIYDVMIRCAAYRVIRLRKPDLIDMVEYEDVESEDNEIDHTYYIYIDQDVFYKCSMNEYGVFKKQEDGSYLVPEYSIDAVCFDKEWFDNHPEEEYLAVDDVPEFFEMIRNEYFDLAYNSDPDLFDRPFILYYDRESAKRAFMERKKTK